MTDVRFLAAAEHEMLEAAGFYETQAAGLGVDFLSRVEAAVRDAAEHPKMWPVVRLNVRRRLLSRFPFAILFRHDPGSVLILAVMHLRRHPGYWVDRL